MMRHQCNLYGVTGRAGEDKASASFVGFLHLFNHACCPNVVFDSATPSRPATLQAARRLKKRLQLAPMTISHKNLRPQVSLETKGEEQRIPRGIACRPSPSR